MEFYSLEQRLQQNLRMALKLFAQTQGISLLGLEESDRRSIPLYLARGTQAIVYQSAIALQIAGQQGSSPREIACQLASAFPHRPGDEGEIDVRAVGSGWLEFQVSDRALADWLQCCLTHPHLSPPLPSLSPPDFFNVQYARARCCSLLCLGHQERLIQLQESYQWVSPAPLPWLSGSGALCLQHPTARQLIRLLLQVVDADARSDRPNWLQLAVFLSEALLNFDRDCRILGEVAPELAQARLGLVAITQILLARLLEVKLGVVAIAHL